MTSRKRSRNSITEENRAECPFTISYVSGPARPEQQDRQKNKKRKREGGGSGQEEEKRVQVQMSPFSPTGAFKTHDTMDLHYTVEPSKRWTDMTRYNSFVLNGIKYYSEGFVYVANEATIERQRAAASLGNVGPIKKSDDDWVARILEIRAADEHHVYARVYWMYWPDELPYGTIDGKKSVQGRQPYHGQNELIASNHMDVINVVSVTMPATVNQWIETDDDEIQDALYWRQAFDCRNSQLSSVHSMCKCEAPQNPDKMIIGCTNSKCGKWMHHDCLQHEVLMKVYERLGNTTPHHSKPPVKQERDESATRPLSPTEAEEKETQPTIDVRSGENQEDNVHVKKPEASTPRATETPTPGPTPVAESKLSAKKRGRKKGADAKPYLGLFEAALQMTDGPITWEITDVREKVTGGEKTWSERCDCLLCGVTIE